MQLCQDLFDAFSGLVFLAGFFSAGFLICVAMGQFPDLHFAVGLKYELQ